MSLKDSDLDLREFYRLLCTWASSLSQKKKKGGVCVKPPSRKHITPAVCREWSEGRTASIRRKWRKRTRCFVHASPEGKVTLTFASWKHWFLLVSSPTRWLALTVLMMSPNIVAICSLTKALTLTSGRVRRIPRIAIICIICMWTSCC